jgi:hypothetical protein
MPRSTSQFLRGPQGATQNPSMAPPLNPSMFLDKWDCLHQFGTVTRWRAVVDGVRYSPLSCCCKRQRTSLDAFRSDALGDAGLGTGPPASRSDSVYPST